MTLVSTPIATAGGGGSLIVNEEVRPRMRPHANARFVNLHWISQKREVVTIDVGGGPSGPSIEGPFCRAVHLCRALGDRKIEKKSKKKQKNNEKRRKNWKKKRKKWVKKGKLQRFCLFSMHFSLFRVILCSSDSSFCRAARLCRALEGRWRPATSHWATAMNTTTCGNTPIFFFLSSFKGLLLSQNHLSC